jgi:hypothetical protein
MSQDAVKPSSLYLTFLLFCTPFTMPLAAESNPEAAAESPATVVDYPADYFERYKPNTALDMVQQVPGFQIDHGDANRGFAGAAGNLLINGRRPSAKQDRPSDILSRVPASQVIGIRVIRGQVRGVDLRGQTTVVDVMLADDAAAAVSWETYALYSTASPLRAGARASLSDRWNHVEYNVGIDLLRDGNGEYGNEYIYDSARTLIETREETQKETGFGSGLFVNASTWLGETFLNLNGKFGLGNSPEIHDSVRTAVSGNPRNSNVKYSQHSETYELGLDAERRLADTLMGKLIVLYTDKLSDVTSTQTNTDHLGATDLFRQADTIAETTEAIARLELDWSGLSNHAIQLNVEGAYNLLDGSLSQIETTGGPVTVVDIPGGNSRVEEARGDFLLKDTWSHEKFEFDYGLGAEVSKITQSGDAELERSFFFLTPQVAVTWTPERGNLSRLRIAREVAQLDFNDFISTTLFEDDDLALGNPNLKPDRTWIAEVSHERRFSANRVIKITAFHHWITDVLDLLPLTASFEVPGNIGDGRRWGIIFENSLPLTALGLPGSRLDVNFVWQDSSVVDPVTGENRVLSAVAGFRGVPDIKFGQDSEYVLNVNYRQDFEAQRIAWGWRMAEQAVRPVFKVDEAERYNEGILASVFVETTRWLGLKIRLEGHNLFNYFEVRDRTTFTGERNLTPVDSYALRERIVGRRVNLVLTGNF